MHGKLKNSTGRSGSLADQPSVRNLTSWRLF